MISPGLAGRIGYFDCSRSCTVIPQDVIWSSPQVEWSSSRVIFYDRIDDVIIPVYHI